MFFCIIALQYCVLMKKIFFVLVISSFFFSCKENKEIDSVSTNNWKKRMIDYEIKEPMVNGVTYLSVYSQIYSLTEHTTHNLTATISMRNTSISDTIYIKKAAYYSTKGELIRSYFDKTIFLKPLETVEIVIEEKDEEGGTGTNFIFDWFKRPNSTEPLFEGVMISTSGQQGLSFTTKGQRIK